MDAACEGKELKLLRIGPPSNNTHPPWHPHHIHHPHIPVLRAPALDEAHTDGTHPRELVHRFKALVDGLSQQSRKLLVVEDFQITSCKQKVYRLVYLTI